MKYLMIAAVLGFGLAACEPNEADDAASDAGATVEDAGDTVQDAADDAGDAVQGAADDAGFSTTRCSAAERTRLLRLTTLKSGLKGLSSRNSSRSA